MATDFNKKHIYSGVRDNIAKKEEEEEKKKRKKKKKKKKRTRIHGVLMHVVS